MASRTARKEKLVRLKERKNINKSLTSLGNVILTLLMDEEILIQENNVEGRIEEN